MNDLQNKKILIIDDAPVLGEILDSVFSYQKARVQVACSGAEGLQKFYNFRPNLVILDLMMPTMSGWEVCRQIRNLSDVPLIMLTALSESNQVTEGLGIGADDYVTKPFHHKVLVARAQALLRRVEHPYGSAPEISTYSDDYLTIDLNRRLVQVDSKAIKLTSREYRLLAYLVKNAGQVLTFQQILENVWGWECQDLTGYVHTYMWRLRKKLEQNPRQPAYLLSEHGTGYRFKKQPRTQHH